MTCWVRINHIYYPSIHPSYQQISQALRKPRGYTDNKSLSSGGSPSDGEDQSNKCTLGWQAVLSAAKNNTTRSRDRGGWRPGGQGHMSTCVWITWTTAERSLGGSRRNPESPVAAVSDGKGWGIPLRKAAEPRAGLGFILSHVRSPVVGARTEVELSLWGRQVWPHMEARLKGRGEAGRMASSGDGWRPGSR